MATTAEELNKKKTYPVDDDDIEHEKEIVEAIKKLDLEQRFQFIALNNLVLEKKQQDTELDGEMRDIINRYNKLQEPFTTASDEIIAGKRALNEEELNYVKQHLNEEETTKLADTLTNTAIPEYWSTAINNCLPLQSYIQEHDKPILKHLTQVDHDPEEDNDNFTLKFHFSANEYFENESLSIKFYLLNENEPEKTEGTEITWKEGKNITKKTKIKKQKNKKTGKTREIKKEVDAESFFNFFNTIKPEENDDADEENEEDMQKMEQLDMNFDIAQNVESELLPYHLEYFLGIREPDEDEDDDDDFGDEDEDDEDDDEEEAPKPKKKAKGKKKGSDDINPAGAGGDKQECKQQ